MAHGTKETESLIGLLGRAGCADSEARRIGDCIRAEDFRTARLLLRRHRAALLAALHESQERIDCLDFIVYRIDKIQNTR